MNKNCSDYQLDTMLKNYCARRSQVSFDAHVEEKIMTKRKGFRIAATAFVLLAVLSVGILRSGIFTSVSSDTDSGFVIKAYAADEAEHEISGKNFTKIGNIRSEMIIQGNIMKNVDKGVSPNLVGALMDFDIRCDGKDIEKLTYKVENAEFFIDGKSENVFDLKASQPSVVIPVREGNEVFWHFLDEYDGKKALSGKDCFSSFSVKYSDQDRLKSSDGSNFSRIELLTAYNNDSDKDMSDKELFENMINKVTVSVKATYKNGKTETQKIKLNGVYDEDYGISVSAKLIS